MRFIPLRFTAVVLFTCGGFLWCCHTAYHDGRSTSRPWEHYATPAAPGWEKTRQMFHIDEEPTTRPTDTPTTAPSRRPLLPPEMP